MRPPVVRPRVAAFCVWMSLAVTPLASSAPTQDAKRTAAPHEATVYIRVVGTVSVEVTDTWSEESQTTDVELGTGSGFVVTPYGHVLTNHHVVAGEEFEKEVAGKTVRGKLQVSQIEVVLPAGAGGLSGSVALPATVEVADPELDLAVLAVSGASFRYLALGDSDASQPGQSVTALGFPFGRKVELGLTSLPDIAPTVSVSSGSVAAMRQNAEGDASFLQVNATVNPGNSGGPVVDEEGFVLGVMRLKLKETDGIGFAIPVNSVKDFLEFNGYADLLPTRRFRLGATERLDDKQLEVGILGGFEDRAPSRLQVYASDDDGRVELQIDRVATTWSNAQLEQELLTGARLAPFVVSGGANRGRQGSEARGGSLFGFASGVFPGTSNEAKIEYLILGNPERPDERLIARYVGDSEAVAFNQSVLRRSLASLSADSMISAPIEAPLATRGWKWDASRASSGSAPAVALPAHWLVEEAPALPCQRAVPADAALSAIAPSDFRVSLRTSYWHRAMGEPVEELRNCGSPVTGITGAAGASGGTRDEYRRSYEWLGIEYLVRGTVHAYHGGTLQRELVAPKESFAHLDGVFEAWQDQFSESSPGAGH